MTKAKALTFHPSKKKRIGKHGFRKRRQNHAGQKVLLRRMRKGRKKLIP